LCHHKPLTQDCRIIAANRRTAPPGLSQPVAGPASRRAWLRAAAAFAGAKGPLDLSLFPAHPLRPSQPAVALDSRHGVATATSPYANALRACGGGTVYS